MYPNLREVWRRSTLLLKECILLYIIKRAMIPVRTICLDDCAGWDCTSSCMVKCTESCSECRRPFDFETIRVTGRFIMLQPNELLQMFYKVRKFVNDRGLSVRRDRLVMKLQFAKPPLDTVLRLQSQGQIVRKCALIGVTYDLPSCPWCELYYGRWVRYWQGIMWYPKVPGVGKVSKDLISMGYCGRRETVRKLIAFIKCIPPVSRGVLGDSLGKFFELVCDWTSLSTCN